MDANEVGADGVEPEADETGKRQPEVDENGKQPAVVEAGKQPEVVEAGKRSEGNDDADRFLKNVSELIDHHESVERTVAELSAELEWVKAEKALLVVELEMLKRSVDRLGDKVQALLSSDQDDMVAEVHDRVRRSSNVLLFKMPDSPSESFGELRAGLADLLSHVGLSMSAAEPLVIKRLGAFRGVPRPVLVVFQSPTHARVIIKNKARLKMTARWKNVSVGKDMTVSQRHAMKLRNE